MTRRAENAYLNAIISCPRNFPAFRDRGYREPVEKTVAEHDRAETAFKRTAESKEECARKCKEEFTIQETAIDLALMPMKLEIDRRIAARDWSDYEATESLSPSPTPRGVTGPGFFGESSLRQ